MQHTRLLSVLVFAGALALTSRAAATPIAVVVDEAARPPYTLVRELVSVTVGENLSLVDIACEYVYIPQYDTPDRRDPMLIDVPVLVRATDTDPAKILKLANVRLEIGRTPFRPREVLFLDHEKIAPVPWLPEGVRIALVSFNLPRKAIKPRFRAHISYDQPHVLTADGEKLAGWVPFLPDWEQLHEVMRFKPDDFMVTFSAQPGFVLRHDTANIDLALVSPATVAVRPRHRETIGVIVGPAPLAPPDDLPPPEVVR